MTPSAMYKLVEKRDPQAVHGLFSSKASALRFLAETVPDYCKRGFYSDKTLKPNSFKVIRA